MCFGNVLNVALEKMVSGSKISMCELGKNLYVRNAGERNPEKSSYARSFPYVDAACNHEIILTNHAN